MYKTLKDLPLYPKGSILVENDNDYSFTISPFSKYSKVEVEECNEWFELTVDNWENGEVFYYISTDFQIEKKEFNGMQHHRLVLNGNAFKDIDSATWIKEKISMLLNDDDLILTNSDTIMKIVTNIKTNNVEDSIKILMGLL